MPENLGGWLVAAIIVAAWVGIIALVDRHARGKGKKREDPER